MPIPKSIQSKSEGRHASSQKAWESIGAKIEELESHSTNADSLFESICRELWLFVNDEEKMEDMGFNGFYDIFKDPEIISLIESPTVAMKIDLHRYMNQNRFYNLLWWDSVFPELNLLQERHLTVMTQRNGAIGEMKELITNRGASLFVDGGDGPTEEIKRQCSEKAKEILFNGDKKEKKEVEHDVTERRTTNNLDIIIDGIPAIRFPREDAESNSHLIRLRSRILHLPRERWYVDVPGTGILLSTEDGVTEYGKLLTNNKKVLEYLEQKGIKIKS